MAEVKIAATSGGGSVGLVGPSTTTGNVARQITLPDVANGTLRTTTTPGAVLQVIHGSTSTGVSQTSTGTKFDTNLSASITPSSASSKVLIIVSQSTMVRSTASGSYYGALHLLRGSTVIIDGLGDGNGNNIGGRNEYDPTAYNTTQNMTSLNYLDSPNTTSATTYKTQGELITSNSTMKCQESDTTSFITLMEIAA